MVISWGKECWFRVLYEFIQFVCMLFEVCGLFSGRLNNVGLCVGLSCGGLCTWIGDVAMCQFRNLGMLYNLHLGG
jgi:hypothetical protein